MGWFGRYVDEVLQAIDLQYGTELYSDKYDEKEEMEQAQPKDEPSPSFLFDLSDQEPHA